MPSTQDTPGTQEAGALPRERGLLLKNLADFQTELARVVAGFVPGIEDWGARNGTPRQVFTDFRMVQDIRVRHKELGVAPGEVHLSEAAPATALLRKLCAAPDTWAMFDAVYVRVKGDLARWIESLLQATRGVYDLPTVPVLESNLELLAAQAEWAAGLKSSPGAASPDYLAEVDVLLKQLHGALSVVERRQAAPLRKARQIGRLPLPDGATPAGFASRASLPPRPGEESPYPERERFYAMNFLQEMQAADSCASLLFDAPDMPWEFYFDVARHMWDESRHSMFGQIKLESLGIAVNDVALSTTAYRLRQTIAPHDRYAALTTQEADAFPGKHEGLKAALENNDTVGAMTWSYDIADETQHVRYGQKWLPSLIKALGDPRSPEQVRTDAENWRESVLAVAYRPGASRPAGGGPA